MASVQKLDEIADRLGALYQLIGRIEPTEVSAGDWADGMDELVRITQDLELLTGRAKRQRNIRKRARRAAREAASHS